MVFGAADMDEVSLLREVVHQSTGFAVVVDNERFMTLLLDRLTLR
ncbi:MAG: hypothetical protein ACR2JG_02480 [Geodermatophilaceae bacterium]